MLHERGEEQHIQQHDWINNNELYHLDLITISISTYKIIMDGGYITFVNILEYSICKPLQSNISYLLELQYKL